ncbi:Hypothetical protein GLP15_1935 [Giardia lamblia P15]|uniref:Uncharacterized protein n=1 Tax=Giardia intestinalis (strain P15) TaxID=658858 RepID=E1F636_GIAIA|nr:Hypothetical protein GLP15_1935 [Giardia lamblia P15]
MDGKAPETSFLRNSRVSLIDMQPTSEVDLLSQARAYLSVAPLATLPTPPLVDKTIAGDKLTHLTQRFQSLDSNRMHWFVRLQALIYINDHLTKDDMRPYISILVPGSIQPLMKQLHEKRKTFTPFLSSILIEFSKVSPLHIAPVAHEILAYCLRDRSNQAMDCVYTICQEVPLSQAAWEAILLFIFDQQYSNFFKEKFSTICDEPENTSPLPLEVKQQILELACESTVHYGLSSMAAQAISAGGYDTRTFSAKGVEAYARILCGMFSARTADGNTSLYGTTSKLVGTLSKTVKFDESSINITPTPGKVPTSIPDLRHHQPELSSGSTFLPPQSASVIGHSIRPSIQEEMNSHPVVTFGSTGGASIIGAMSGLSATPSARESIEDMIGVADVNAALDNVANSTHKIAPVIHTSTPPFAKKSQPVTKTSGDALEQFIREASLGPTFFNESQAPQDADTTMNLLEQARNLVSSQSVYASDANETMNMDDLLSYVNNLSKTNASRRVTGVMGVPPIGPSQSVSMASPGMGISSYAGLSSHAGTVPNSTGYAGYSMDKKEMIERGESLQRPLALQSNYSSMEELNALRQTNKDLETQLNSAKLQIQEYVEKINNYNDTLLNLQTESVSTGASTQLYLQNLALQGELDSLKSGFDRLTEKYQALKERDRTMMDRLDKYENKQQQFKTMFEQATERYETMKRVTNDKLLAYKEENDKLRTELTSLQQGRGELGGLHGSSGKREESNSSAEIAALRSEIEALKNDKANLTAVTKRLIAKLSVVSKQTTDT